jgi:hypothetical protein
MDAPVSPCPSSLIPHFPPLPLPLSFPLISLLSLPPLLYFYIINFINK